MKRCTACDEVLSLEAFDRNRRAKDGRHTQCKQCKKAKRSSPEHYERARMHDRRRRASVVARNRATRLAKKLRLVEAHGGRCADCQQSWPPYVLEFDHRDPAAKRFLVSGSRLTNDYEALLAEAQKCDLVCSNCHRVRTHRQRCEGCDYCHVEADLAIV